MSYDVYLRGGNKCKYCSRADTDAYIEHDSPTYNLTPIFHLALTREPMPSAEVSEFEVVVLAKKTEHPRGLRVLNGRKAKETIVQLECALIDLRDPAKRAAFTALEPSNGWGNLKDATECIESYLKAAQENPDHVWEIR